MPLPVYIKCKAEDDLARLDTVVILFAYSLTTLLVKHKKLMCLLSDALMKLIRRIISFTNALIRIEVP